MIRIECIIFTLYSDIQSPYSQHMQTNCFNVTAIESNIFSQRLSNSMEKSVEIMYFGLDYI